jgi:hypothetical protein
MSENVTAFLGMSPSDSPEMITLPDGKYRFQIAGYTPRAYGQDGNVLVQVNLKVIEVVDSDNLTEDQLPFVDTVRQTYFCTDKALASSNPAISLKSFLKFVLAAHKTPEEVDAEEYKVLLEMIIGQEFIGLSKINMGGKNKDIPTPAVTRFFSE